MFDRERFKYYGSVFLTLLLFLTLLFFGLNITERNINQLAGIETTPRSFCIEMDQNENLVVIFAGNQVSFPLNAVLKACFQPGRLIHTIYLRGEP